MSQSISKDFHTWSLLKFAFPSVVMMVFMSLYTIIDGIFISRLVGADALSASNIVYPAISIIYAVGIMIASGGSAVSARQLGEGNPEKARNSFTFLTVTGMIFGICAMIVGALWITPLVRMMGATDKILADCQDYLRIILFFAPACVLQLIFQTFFVAAGRPALGLVCTIIAGAANAVLDYLFMGPLHMGISGAALATGIGQLIPSVIGILFFLISKKELFFVPFHFDWKVLAESCFNGSSEMVTNLSTAVVTYLFNMILLHLIGEEGVAAITIIFYGQFLFNALFMGYSMGVAPVISFNYGCQNHTRLFRIFRICTRFIVCSALVVTFTALWGTPFIIGVFTPRDTSLYPIALRGFFLFSFNYLFAGFNIFSSSMFTALSNGFTSALISFLRTFGFLTGCILLLPSVLGVDGVWISVPFAEFLTCFVSVFCYHRNIKKMKQ